MVLVLELIFQNSPDLEMTMKFSAPIKLNKLLKKLLKPKILVFKY